MLLEHTIEIRKSPEDVFAFLAHQPNHVQFVKENVASEQVSPGPMGVGTRLQNTARVFGRTMVEKFEVVAFEPPRVLAKSSREGSSLETTDRFELTAIPGGTHIKFVVTGTPRTLGERLLIALMGPVVRRSMRRSLATLKAILERPS